MTRSYYFYATFVCISNSSEFNVGEITGPNRTADFDIYIISYPYDQPGAINVRVRRFFLYHAGGIFTCTIPDANGNNITINVGFYHYDLIGK